MAVKYSEIEIWEDVLRVLQEASPEQLKQPVQICDHHPVEDYVHGLKPGIALGIVDALEIKYARSVTDNRRHGEHLIIYTDYNPYAEDGAIAYEWDLENDCEHIPIYPKDHDESKDWTGPAQRLIDQKEPRT